MESISLDQVKIPDYILREDSRFVFDQQCIPGCMHWGPNGRWIWDLGTPLVTWLLDRKIQHASRYTNDHEDAWATSLGPNSVQELLQDIDVARRRIEALDI